MKADEDEQGCSPETATVDPTSVQLTLLSTPADRATAPAPTATGQSAPTTATQSAATTVASSVGVGTRSTVLLGLLAWFL